jgi:hypothetical protein
MDAPDHEKLVTEDYRKLFGVSIQFASDYARASIPAAGMGES